MLTAVLASIPSPSSGEIKLGPLQLRAYGLMIALGVLAAVWLAGRRLEARGVGTREDMSYVALWAVPAGVIGSRLYHVATDWRRYEGHWLDAFKIWEGGLGIWGGIGLGVVVGIWAGMRRGIPLQGGLSAITPALPLAQAIGRWGNWWNQELFGRPTDLPWALEVSPGKAVAAGYPAGTTFHPTFLYESLWCLFLCGALIWIDKRFKPKGTELFAMYVAGYTFVRFWIERLRVDPATILWGWRINEVVSLVVCGLAILYLIYSMTRRHDDTIAVQEVAVSEPISPADVAHVARLARLELSAAEIDRYTEQLGTVIEHFHDIDELDLADVVPMYQPLPLQNVFRDDVIGPTLDRDEVLAAAPEAEGGRFRVPPILGEAP